MHLNIPFVNSLFTTAVFSVLAMNRLFEAKLSSMIYITINPIIVGVFIEKVSSCFIGRQH